MVCKLEKCRLINKLVKIQSKICDFFALWSKIFAHGEVEIIVVHAEIVVQGLGGLKQ